MLYAHLQNVALTVTPFCRLQLVHEVLPEEARDDLCFTAELMHIFREGLDIEPPETAWQSSLPALATVAQPPPPAYSPGTSRYEEYTHRMIHRFNDLASETSEFDKAQSKSMLCLRQGVVSLLSFFQRPTSAAPSGSTTAGPGAPRTPQVFPTQTHDDPDRDIVLVTTRAHEKRLLNSFSWSVWLEQQATAAGYEHEIPEGLREHLAKKLPESLKGYLMRA